MTATIDKPDLEFWAYKLREAHSELEAAQATVEELSSTKKAIMHAAYDSGLSLKDLATLLDVSKERVSIMLGRRISKQREQVREAIVKALTYVGAEGGTLAEIHDAVTQGLGYDPGRPSIGSYLRTDSKQQFVQVGPATYALRIPDVHDEDFPGGDEDEDSG